MRITAWLVPRAVALGGSRAEPWPYFLSPGCPGPETDMRSPPAAGAMGIVCCRIIWRRSLGAFPGR
jgi:hypothetical protein